jgi:divalent metal cation (Fe/Co/Zn/Cd) transporter
MEAPNRTHAVIRLQWLSVLWMAIEFAVAVVLGIKASSLALVAFGGDSAVELFSAAVVLHRFYAGEHAERNATRIAAILLYLLAAFVFLSSIASLFNGNLRAEPSYLGISFLIAAAVIMPWLGRRKRALAAITCSSALKADAAQSSICAYMSWIALGSLVVNAVFHLPWVDSAAALLLVPLILYEANEARKGHACC